MVQEMNAFSTEITNVHVVPRVFVGADVDSMNELLYPFFVAFDRFFALFFCSLSGFAAGMFTLVSLFPREFSCSSGGFSLGIGLSLRLGLGFGLLLR